MSCMLKPFFVHYTGKLEPNGNPNTPLMADGMPQNQGPMNQMSRMAMNQGSGMGSLGMGPGQGPQMGQGTPMSQGGPMGSGPGGMGPGMMGGPMGPGGPVGPNGGPQQQVASEGHLVQQQSEIFVFTTQLANEAAHAVQSGQYKNILSFHMDQPSTKKFLQVAPL